MKGNVRVIKMQQNYGFLRGEDGNDYFFHRDSCSEKFDGLRPGSKVDFTPVETQKGKRAEDVFQL